MSATRGVPHGVSRWRKEGKAPPNKKQRLFPIQTNARTPPPLASPEEAARRTRSRLSLPAKQRVTGQGRGAPAEGGRAFPLLLRFLPAWPRTCPARCGSSRSWQRLNAAARPPPPAKGAPWPLCSRLRAQSPRASEVPEPGLPTTTPPRKSGRRSAAAPQTPGERPHTWGSTRRAASSLRDADGDPEGPPPPPRQRKRPASLLRQLQEGVQAELVYSTRFRGLVMGNGERTRYRTRRLKIQPRWRSEEDPRGVVFSPPWLPPPQRAKRFDMKEKQIRVSGTQQF